ncbi:hypothetical protein TIFTF001_025357 [Ficus carica]|uniref:Uncharacterized protein n=1 Tax=Ficus carica TaxID=3494 RepID=A0AA88AP18_FICCA|nr:hypothetical protein TIFTF001_025357 [Ficus carica]
MNNKGKFAEGREHKGYYREIAPCLSKGNSRFAEFEFQILKILITESHDSRECDELSLHLIRDPLLLGVGAKLTSLFIPLTRAIRNRILPNFIAHPSPMSDEGIVVAALCEEASRKMQQSLQSIKCHLKKVNRHVLTGKEKFRPVAFRLYH